MAYQAVVHGAKGILYYGQYHCSKPNTAASLSSSAEDPAVREKEFQRCLQLNREFWDEHRPFFKELEQASKIFTLRDATAAESLTADATARAAAIVVMTKKAGEQLYVIVVNESQSDAQVRLALPPAFKEATMHVLFEDRTVVSKDGHIDDRFKPYDAHVYATTDRLP